MKPIYICIFVLLAQLSFALPKVFVVQTLDESAAMIDIGTNDVDTHAATLGTLPNDIVVHKNRVYVANSGYNTIQEIDAATETTLREIQVSGGVNVWSMAFLNDDSLAVSCLLSNNVTVIRLSDEQTVATLDAGVAPQAIVAYEDFFYVGVTGVDYPVFGPASIFVYDRASLERVDSIAVGINPQSLAVDHQNRLHIVCTGDYGSRTGEVHIIDLDSRQVESILSVGGSPTNISLGADVAYLSAGGWGSDGYVYSYSLSSLEVLHDFSNPITVGSGAFDVEAFDDGSFLVSCFNDDKAELRRSDGTLAGTFLLSDGPAQMALYDEVQAVSELPVALASSVVLADPYPNPFNSQVRLSLTQPSKTSSKIHIYNTMGQSVAALTIPAGAVSIFWNGNDDYGNAVSSGVYIVTQESFQTVSSKRLILLK